MTLLDFETTSATLRISRGYVKNSQPIAGSEVTWKPYTVELEAQMSAKHMSPFQKEKFAEKPAEHLAVHLDPAWRATQPDMLEFILIEMFCHIVDSYRDDNAWSELLYGKGFDGHHTYLMLIERRSEIAYRVAVCGPIPAKNWWQLSREKKLILLG